MLFNNSGILGMNARNLLYVRPFNNKKAVRFADDKLKTKHFLSARGIPVPRLYAVIRSAEELERFTFSSLPKSFVLKPNLGFGGEGIIPIIDTKGESFIKASGESMSKDELKEQINDILEGAFSISELQDAAFFEQLIICDPRLAKFCYKGLPDIRVVVHNLIPVMAMLRLPTRESDGKANLHQGAVGVGIDIAKGTATHIVYKGRVVDEVPGAGPIRGFTIPYWDEILLIASRIQLATNLGYCAVDVSIDHHAGPVLLEINARAGLAVQIANLAPLRRRLERIQGVKVTTPEKGVRIAQELFGLKIEKGAKEFRDVIGNLEEIKIIAPGEVRHAWASINPILEGSILDKKLAEELGLTDETESGQLRVKFSLGTKRIQTLVYTEDFSGKDYSMVIGKRDLQGFLIDPMKGKNKVLKLPALLTGKDEVILFFEADRELATMDRQIQLLSHLKPSNLKQESEKFLANPSYNPQFEYRKLSFDPHELKTRLEKIEGTLDDSPLGSLFRKKAQEHLKKIWLLEARGKEDFTNHSFELYGKPSEHLIAKAREKLEGKPKVFLEPTRYFSVPEATVEFERVFREYGLDHWRVKVNRHMISACSAGKECTLFIREGAQFSEERLRMVIAHEIETHILTAENGKYQIYELFNRGFGDFLETQEGLAIWNQEQVSTINNEKNYRSATLIFVIEFAHKHGFAETYDYCLKLGMAEDRAMQATLKVKRGLRDTSKSGVFTKDGLYFSGYLQVQDFVVNGGDLKNLYYGKYNLDDLPFIRKIPGLKEPKILPHFLS
ncbi:MAG: tyrosine/phenylalanine carboxypeptidase domain-containing protein [Candidatus Gracilibacteria bacterium]